MANREWVGLQQRPPNAVDGREQMEEVSDSNPLPVKITQNIYATNIHFRTGQVAIGTSAAQVLPANPTRLRVEFVQITGTQIAYLGLKSPVVTAANGHTLTATAGTVRTLYTQDEIWGIAAAAPQTVSYIEEYLG